MTREEFERLQRVEASPREVSVADLKNQVPRTLIYGYTVGRETFHLYLTEAQQLVLVIYDHDQVLLFEKSGSAMALTDCVPDKRVYPEACDAEFCQLLQERGISIPYTTFNEKREENLWHGLRQEVLLDCAILQQVSIPFNVEPDDIGLPARATDLFVKLSQSAMGSIEGYLKGAIIRKEPLEKLDRWLENIPGNVVYYVRNYLEDETWELSESLSQALVSRAKSAVASHLASLPQ